MRILDGAITLNRMIVQGRKVYVHCTAGMGRAPAVVLVYLCLFHPEKMEPLQADKYVKSFRSVSVPNMAVVT
jgi:protein-tyrosine phosphatase